MKAVKGNKEYTISETQKNQYVQDGFDIVDDVGNVLQNGAGKSVSYEKYKAALDENTALKEQIADLQKQLATALEKVEKEVTPPKK